MSSGFSTSPEKNRPTSKGSHASTALLAVAVAALAMPSSIMAFTTNFEPKFTKIPPKQTPEQKETEPQLAEAMIRSLAKGPLYLFTPAGTPSQPNRSITVAVRMDDQTVKAITVHGHPVMKPQRDTSLVRIAPDSFNLGVARGYNSFAIKSASDSDTKPAPITDISTYKPKIAPAETNARFNSHIALDERKATGRAARTFAGDPSEQVDVGGSYRVTKNINVTAGVRYSQERERLLPLTDGKQDNQAVYVGTQFRF